MIEALNSGWLVAITVAVLPALLGVISNLALREARTPREIRNLGNLAESLSKIPTGTDAHKAMNGLLAEYVARVRVGLVDPRKLNKFSVGMSVFLLLVTFVAMYFLVNWIVASPTGWNVVAVIVTVLCGLFLFLLNVASVTAWYNPPTPSKSK